VAAYCHSQPAPAVSYSSFSFSFYPCTIAGEAALQQVRFHDWYEWKARQLFASSGFDAAACLLAFTSLLLESLTYTFTKIRFIFLPFSDIIGAFIT